MFGKKHSLHHYFILQAIRQYSKYDRWDYYSNQYRSQFTKICWICSMGNYCIKNDKYIFSFLRDFISALLRLIITPTTNGASIRNASSGGEITLRSKHYIYSYTQHTIPFIETVKTRKPDTDSLTISNVCFIKTRPMSAGLKRILSWLGLTMPFMKPAKLLIPPRLSNALRLSEPNLRQNGLRKLTD